MAMNILNLQKENACGCVDRALNGSHECLCPTAGLVQIVSRKHALPLLSLIAERGVMRFGEIRSEMDDMSPSTLTIRLKELEQSGLVERQTFAEVPPRVEYSLTKEGEKFRKSLLSLSRFATRK